MEDNLKNRVIAEANYIKSTKNTLRDAASRFNVSKSTIHVDLKERLKKIDSNLSKEIADIFDEHNKYKHIRGGEKTQEKYKKR